MQEVTEPFDPTQTTTRYFQHDQFGNVVNVTLVGTGIPRPRFTLAAFHSNGRFVGTVTNALGYPEYLVLDVDVRFGVPLTVAVRATCQWHPSPIGSRWKLVRRSSCHLTL